MLERNQQSQAELDSAFQALQTAERVRELLSSASLTTQNELKSASISKAYELVSESGPTKHLTSEIAKLYKSVLKEIGHADASSDLDTIRFQVAELSLSLREYIKAQNADADAALRLQVEDRRRYSTYFRWYEAAFLLAILVSVIPFGMIPFAQAERSPDPLFGYAIGISFFAVIGIALSDVVLMFLRPTDD